MNCERATWISMICAYLDESGNTGGDLTDPTQPFHYVGALLVPEIKWAVVSQGVDQVKSFAREKGFSKETCELHGKDILHGTRGWRQVSVADRLVILEQCVDLMEAHDLKLVRGGCDKKRLGSRYLHPEPPHSIALWLCLERIAIVAKGAGELAVMIADDCNWSNKELSQQTLFRYRKYGAPFGPTVDFSSLIDVIHFMSSHDSPHIQLCDVAMYIHRRYTQTNDPRVEALWVRCNKRYALPSGLIPY